MQKRNRLEQEALQPFENIAIKNGFTPIEGQGHKNRILLGNKRYFQFGDLRVDTEKHHVVIEAESAGGITNLVKYWYCLANKTLSKQILMPIILLHLFQQTGPDDYGSHLELWDSLWSEMQKANIKIQAYKYPYHNLSELKPAIDRFKESITLL